MKPDYYLENHNTHPPHTSFCPSSAPYLFHSHTAYGIRSLFQDYFKPATSKTVKFSHYLNHPIPAPAPPSLPAPVPLPLPLSAPAPLPVSPLPLPSISLVVSRGSMGGGRATIVLLPSSVPSSMTVVTMGRGDGVRTGVGSGKGEKL